MAPAKQPKNTTPKDAPVQIGDMLAGKYRVEGVLGVGGMGAVVAARHVDLDELRAIKFMKPEMRTNAQAESRFMREARAAAKLKSDHVARVHDIGRFDTGEPYMVIEYLDGQDLKSLLKAEGPLDPELAVVFILQACEALAEAHAAGIVHRDLKPSNLFVIEGTDGRLKVKLLDFGISKLTGALAEQAGMDLTHTSAIMGSPLYMSPEQMASTRDIDARTDVWSLGVIFYQLVTGKRPFRGKTVTAVTISVTSDDPRPPSELRPDLPEELDTIIEHCLQKDPDARYASVSDLANDLVLLAPPHARGLIDKIERVASRASSSGRVGAVFSSSPGSSGSFDALESGSRSHGGDGPLDISISGIERKTDDDVPDEAPTVRTGDSQHPHAQRIATPDPEAAASTAATWQANTESIELPTHRSRIPLVAALVALGVVIGGALALRGGSDSAGDAPAATSGARAESDNPTGTSTSAPKPASSVAVAPSTNAASTDTAPSAAPSASTTTGKAPAKVPSAAGKPAGAPNDTAPKPAPVVPKPPVPSPVTTPRPPTTPKAPPPDKDPFGPGWRD